MKMLIGTSIRLGLSLIELMIVILLLSILLWMTSEVMMSSTSWNRVATTNDILAQDIKDTWQVLDEDFNRSLWYYPAAPTAGGSLAVDRTLFYLPFISQPSTNTAAPLIAGTRLAIFNRNDDTALPFRLDLTTWAFSRLATVAEINAEMPGSDEDSAVAPSGVFSEGTTYETNFFAPSQEIAFVRLLHGSWEESTNSPKPVTGLGPSLLPGPTEFFRQIPEDVRTELRINTTEWWRRAGNQDALGVLHPSPFTRGPDDSSGAVTWLLRPSPTGTGFVDLPYGRVLDAGFLEIDPNTASTTLRPLVEQNGPPDFQTQTPADVRLLGYQVVPSPIGFGRLVRTYVLVDPATPPPAGVEPGQCIALSTIAGSTEYLVVDRVVSDNVVRVLFETARHDNGLGINGIRATVFFAKMGGKSGVGNALIQHRVVTMIFAMRGSNTATSQEATRQDIRPGDPATGAIPFTY